MTFLTCALLVAFAAPSEPAPPVPFDYRVRLEASALRRAEVQGRVRLKGGALSMAAWGFPPSLPNGWATFVEDLHVTRDGAEVQVTLEPPGRWRVDAPDGTILDLRYAVRLGHDAVPWDEAGGSDARPAVHGEAVTWITRGLIILSDDDAAPARVRFDVPPGWQVSTPWAPVAGQPGAFAPPDLASLYDNVVVAGRHLHREVKRGAPTLVLAVDRELAGQLPLVEQTLARVLEEYGAVFGGLPEARWLVALRRDSVDDGEAFDRSFVQTFRRSDLERSRIVWANLLAHELFHLWNGARIAAAGPAAWEWFKEGFTEYYANRALLRTGAIRQDEWLQKVGFHLGRYWGSRHFTPPPRPSLEAAGKAKMANWRLIYGGGATLALLLDIELRAASDGSRSLDDVMRGLERRRAETDAPFTRDEFLAVLGSVGGDTARAFHTRYVANADAWPDVEEVLRKAGLRVVSFADEFYVKPDPGAGKPALRLLRALTGAPTTRTAR